MSISPIITFKAGLCDLNTSTEPPRVKPLPQPGYIYLYSEDDLVHFCWRPRSAPLDNPGLDLVMIPTDGSFTPYEPSNPRAPSNSIKATNGRIYVLKFTSSSQRHLFWLQSRSQHESGDSTWFSARDLKLGQIVNTLLQGEDIDVQQAIAEIPSDQNGDDDDDATMEDVEGQNPDADHQRGGSGGAGPNATGGDVREEGQGAREGGADGGRAARTASTSTDASSIIQNFLKSMESTGAGRVNPQGNLFTTLADLLTPASTIPLIDSAGDRSINTFLEFLPPNLLALARNVDEGATFDVGSSSGGDTKQAPSLEQKKDVLRRVLRSPQFSQSLSSLTVALRDGGLPSISEALSITVQNGGFMRRGGMPLGGGDAIEVFLNGVKDHVEKRESQAKGQVDIA